MRSIDYQVSNLVIIELRINVTGSDAEKQHPTELSLGQLVDTFVQNLNPPLV